MGFKLTKSQSTERERLVSELRDAHSALEDAARVYGEKLEALKSFVDERADAMRGEFDDKSDTWRESERGAAVEEFISEWESARDSIDDDAPEVPDSPADEIDALATEPSF